MLANGSLNVVVEHILESEPNVEPDVRELRRKVSRLGRRFESRENGILARAGKARIWETGKRISENGAHAVLTLFSVLALAGGLVRASYGTRSQTVFREGS